MCLDNLTLWLRNHLELSLTKKYNSDTCNIKITLQIVEKDKPIVEIDSVEFSVPNN